MNIKLEALLIDNFCKHASLTHSLREKELLTRKLEQNGFWEYGGNFDLVHVFTSIEPDDSRLIEEFLDSLHAIPIDIFLEKASRMVL